MVQANEAVASAPGIQKKVALSTYMPLPEADVQYPMEYIEANSVILLKEEKDSVAVGVCQPVSTETLLYLQSFHDKPVVFHEIDHAELSAYLGKRLATMESEAQKPGAPDDERLLLDRLANDAPIVNLVNSIMIEAIRRGSSDIHIESFAEDSRVRYRIDGVLQTVSRIEKGRFPAVASRIKIMANLNIMERRLPQDGRISVHMADGSFDVRVSIVPIANGESIVLRLFNTTGTALGLEDLGIEKGELALLRRLVAFPHGLVLATGPTGSGKSTTLNALLREVASDEVKIITIEDPVEYVIEGVNQIQTHEQIGLTFDSLLRRVLRQDPDVVMVGEIRDAPTAELSVRAALTGHLVLSTLHTNDSVSVIPRLKNMGVEPYLLAAVIRGAMAQRLVRRICKSCKKPYTASPEEKTLLERHGLSAKQLFKGEGCEACGGSGYKGRVSIVEVFASDETVEQMILKGERPSAIAEYLETKGFRTLMRNGLEAAIKGVTTIMEVEQAAVT